MTNKTLIEKFSHPFPNFAKHLARGLGDPIEEVLLGATESDIKDMEEDLGVLLPDSYKAFIKISRGFWLRGGIIQFSKRHPFFHQRGSTQGLLCFGEYFLMADGDQVLFDVRNGLLNTEYPVYYYDHEWRPPRIIKLADGFEQWLNEFLAKRYDFENP